ncbi:DUF7169 domain-containing protein [Kitasatospora fiedleri]
MDQADAIADVRSVRPPADPDNTGRRASTGPGRPTEDTALDEGRLAVATEIRTAVQYMRVAAAHIRGCRAALDRALSAWEGEPWTREQDAAAEDEGAGCYGAGSPDGADGDPAAA